MLLPWGRGQYPGPPVAAVEPWLVPWVPCGRRGGVIGLLDPVGPPWGRGRSPELVEPPWGRSRYPGHRVAAVGSWLVPFTSWVSPWGRGRSAGHRGSAVGAWAILWTLCGRRGGSLLPWTACGCRGGAAGSLYPVWLPWGRRRSF